MAKTTKKKSLTTLLVVVLMAVVAIGGMLAYLTDRDAKTNIFTVGDVEIELNEEFEQGSTLTPGVDIDKKVTVKNTGKNDAYVWVKIAVPAALDNDDASLNVLHFNYSKEAGYAEEWTWKDTSNNWIVEKDKDINGVLYNEYVVLHKNPLVSGETTTYPAMTKVYLDPHVDIDTNGDWYHVENGVVTGTFWNVKDDGEPVIYVSAYAIQVEEMADIYAAYEAYKGQWGTNGAGDEYAVAPTIYTYEGVNYVTDGDDAQANSVGGDTIYRGVFSDGKTTATNVAVGEGIVRLNDRALCKAPTIKEVSLPNSLTYIDESVFQQSGITEIEIPEKVTFIGKQAFGACGELEIISIKAKNVTIANYVARACANLKEVYIYSDSVTFESGSMYFTNKENADASGITFYVKNQEIADIAYAAFSTSHSYGLLIKSIDGATTYYNTLK